MPKPNLQRGIYFNKQYQKYHVRVSKDGRRIHIGRFKTLEEAVEAKREYLS